MGLQGTVIPVQCIESWESWLSSSGYSSDCKALTVNLRSLRFNPGLCQFSLQFSNLLAYDVPVFASISKNSVNISHHNIIILIKATCTILSIFLYLQTNLYLDPMGNIMTSRKQAIQSTVTTICCIVSFCLASINILCCVLNSFSHLQQACHLTLHIQLHVNL